MYRVEGETGTGGRRGVRCDLGVRDCKYVCVVGRGGGFVGVVVVEVRDGW